MKRQGHQMAIAVEIVLKVFDASGAMEDNLTLLHVELSVVIGEKVFWEYLDV